LTCQHEFVTFGYTKGIPHELKEDAYMNPKLVSIVLKEDGDGIRHNVPNVRYKRWEINSLGFRGKEIDLEKKEGQIRIVCLGGSETFGVFESKDKEWPSQLGEMLGDEFPKAEVINASVAGLTIKNKKAYVEKYVLPLKPDIMITTQGALLPITDSIRGVESKRLGSQVKAKMVKSPVRKFMSHLGIKLRTEEAMSRLLPEFLSTPINTWRLKWKIRKKERRHLIHKEPMDSVPEYIILEFEEDLRLFVEYLKGNHMVPIFLTYPTLFTTMNKNFYRYLLLSIRRLCVELSDDGIIDASEKFNDSIRRIAGKQEVALIDNDLLIPKTPEYFVDYSHYTNQGAEFIARNIYQFLRQSELIKEAAIHRDDEGSP
jgi:lysophospholipase L1-like esterase